MAKDMPGDADGTIVTDGGLFAGWSLMLIDGRPVYAQRTSPSASDLVRINAPEALQPGEHVLTIDFTATNKPGEWGIAKLLVDRKPAGSVSLRGPVPLWQSGEGASLGRDSETAVLPEIKPPFLFEGVVKKVEFTFPNESVEKQK